MQEKSTKWMIPKRYVIVAMVFTGFVNMFYLHTNLGMAVVEMTTLKNVSLADGSRELVSIINFQ